MDFTRDTYIAAFIQLTEDTQSAMDTAVFFNDDVFNQGFLIERAQTAVAIHDRWKREGDGTDLVTLAATAMSDYHYIRREAYDARHLSDSASSESRVPDDGCGW